jgi:hypothetical protein
VASIHLEVVEEAEAIVHPEEEAVVLIRLVEVVAPDPEAEAAGDKIIRVYNKKAW